MRLALAFAVLAAPALAEPGPAVYRQGDTYELTRITLDYAELVFHNGAAMLSPGGEVPLAHDGLEVLTVTLVNFGPGGREALIVLPPPGWRAEPPEAHVLDGETVKVRLFRDGWVGS